MYGLSAEIARPGRYLRDLLVHRIQTGNFSEDPDDYIARLKDGIAEGATFTNIANLADNRVFSIVNRPIAGGGWLATHEDITERRRSEQQIAHMARHDTLTDLPNRILLRETLEHELKRVSRGECLAVLCLDLNQFKSVNDALGHPAGDGLGTRSAVAQRRYGALRRQGRQARHLPVLRARDEHPHESAT
jgi:hypothetical protein